MVNERPVSGRLSDLTRSAQHDIMSADPPALERYLDAPVYDQSIILQLVAVRPLALWSLEQHIGIVSGARGMSETNGQKRRYSERDLVALLWLRERVVEGETPQDAGARLIAAQRLRNSGVQNSGGLSTGGTSGSLGAAQAAPIHHTGALDSGEPGSNYLTQPRFPAVHSGPLSSLDAAQQPPRTTGGLSGQGYSTGALYPASGPDRGDYPGGSWASGSQHLSGTPRPGVGSRPLGPNGTRPLNQMGAGYATNSPLSAGPSGRLGGVYSAPAPITRPPHEFDPARDQMTAHELRTAVAPLMQAFSRFDTSIANRLIQHALERYSVEVVCLGLVQPTITRISELWSRSELTVPEERFALNYLRGFLNSVFHSTLEPADGPLAVIGCAQHEDNDLPALLLSVFWRRSGVRVAYLGADAGGDSLARQEWRVIPAIITLTLSNSQRIRSVNHLAKQLRGQPSPRPELCYTGPIFARNPDLQRKVNAVYLGDDPASATMTVRRLLGIQY